MRRLAMTPSSPFLSATWCAPSARLMGCERRDAEDAPVDGDLGPRRDRDAQGAAAARDRPRRRLARAQVDLERARIGQKRRRDGDAVVPGRQVERAVRGRALAAPVDDVGGRALDLHAQDRLGRDARPQAPARSPAPRAARSPWGRGAGIAEGSTGADAEPSPPCAGRPLRRRARGRGARRSCRRASPPSPAPPRRRRRAPPAPPACAGDRAPARPRRTRAAPAPPWDGAARAPNRAGAPAAPARPPAPARPSRAPAPSWSPPTTGSARSPGSAPAPSSAD